MLAMMLGGCSTAFQPLPGPVEFGHSAKPQGTLAATAPVATQQASTRIATMPVPPLVRAAEPEPQEGPSAAGAATANDEEVSIAIEQTPLPMFIQILYGSVLKRPYSLDPAVNARTEPVTFKTSKPLNKAKVQQIASNLLRSYGLTAIELDGLVRIAPDSAQASPAAVVQFGKKLPEGVDPMRQSYHYIELETVRTAEMTQWLRQILGNRVGLQEDIPRNGFLLSGTQNDLKAALDLIQNFDQPRMRGRVARRITPAYANANELATRLNDVLTTQGYAVSTSGSSGNAAVVLMPVPAIASVFVFTSSTAVMGHVEKWAKELDRPASGASSNALFTYPVKYADAQELARTLGDLLGGSGATAAPAAATGGTATTQRTSFGRVVVNNATNTLIFKGSSAEEQQQIKDLLRELDRPTKSAMIEVVVAEVQKGALESLGIKWDYTNAASQGAAGQRSVKAGAAGFNISYINSANALLGALDALATDSQARILSNPKVLARNGESASIQVGSEVPIITSQQSTSTGGSIFPGSAGIIQQVQYRQTGVLLRVRPVINSGNRLDLDVSQEVSSAAQTQTGVSASPTISTRRIETKLSLRDGSTVLLGGLIARDDSISDSGVPLLKDIPGLGALFRTKSNTNKQTELMVMITPYVVNDDYEAEELTQAVHATFGDWAKDIKRARVVREPTPLEAPQPVPAKSEELPPMQEPSPIVSGPADMDGVRPSAAPALKSAPAKAPVPPSEVTTSQPVNSGQASPPAKKASTPEQAAVPVATKASEPAATAVKPPANVGGKTVTDPKVIEEIQKLLKPK